MHLIHEYGLVAVAAVIGLECLGLPVPGETALLGAAIYAGTKHDFNINAVIATAAGAAMAGRMIGYLIGHKFTVPVLELDNGTKISDIIAICRYSKTAKLQLASGRL